MFPLFFLLLISYIYADKYIDCPPLYNRDKVILMNFIDKYSTIIDGNDQYRTYNYSYPSPNATIICQLTCIFVESQVTKGSKFTVSELPSKEFEIIIQTSVEEDFAYSIAIYADGETCTGSNSSIH